MDLGDRLVAETALRRVDDPLEGEVVGRLGDHPEIGEGVPDLRPLVEAEAADDPVGQADRDEPVLELAGLELGADQDRAFVEPPPMMLERLQLLAHAPRLLGPVPDPDHLDLLALSGGGPSQVAPAA